MDYIYTLNRILVDLRIRISITAPLLSRKHQVTPLTTRRFDETTMVPIQCRPLFDFTQDVLHYHGNIDPVIGQMAKRDTAQYRFH